MAPRLQERSPKHISLSQAVAGARRVEPLSGAGIIPSLPEQTFTIKNPLDATIDTFGLDARRSRGWRRKVPPEVLAEIDAAFPIVSEKGRVKNG